MPGVKFTFDAEKANEAIALLASLGLPGLTKYKICKLLFLADAHHLVKFARPISGDRICAMQAGPVPSRVLNILNAVIDGNSSDQDAAALAELVEVDRRFQHPRFSARKKVEQFALSESDIDSLKTVAAIHGKRSEFEFLHFLPAYVKAWESRSHGSPKMSFEDLFIDNEDALAGVLENMKETDKVKREFLRLA